MMQFEDDARFSLGDLREMQEADDLLRVIFDIGLCEVPIPGRGTE